MHAFREDVGEAKPGLGEREVAPLRIRIRAARLLETQCWKNRAVEPLGRNAVRDADRDVVEHGLDYAN